MSEKRIRTRLQNKHDIEFNWDKAKDFIPLKGELIVYDIEVDSDNNVVTALDEEGNTIPALPEGRETPYTYERFKIGDGVKNPHDLPFVTEFADEHISITSGNPHGITKDMLGVADVYTNDEPLLNNVGGILAKNHPEGFSNVPVTDLITELLYPYTAPTISSLSLTPSATVRKRGTELTVTGASVNVAKKSKSIESVVLYRGSTELARISNPTPSSSGTTLSFPSFSNYMDGTSNVTYTAKVSELNGTADVASTTATFTFVDPYYWGVIDGNAEVTADLVSNLTEDVRTKGNHSREYTTVGQRPVIAYPKSYGVLKSIKDAALPYTWDRYGDDDNFKINGVSYYAYVGSISTLTNTYTFTY